MCSRPSHRESPKPWSALVGAGPFNEGHFAKEAFGFVLAADGGYAHLAGHGLAPDFALGDFDSLGYVPADVPCEIHPTMKDASDTALALAWLKARDYEAVAVYGVLGGQRPEHTFAALASLARAASEGLRVVAVGEEHMVWAIHSDSQIQGCLELPALQEGFVSLFAFGGPVAGLSVQGLKYETRGADLRPDSTLGLSNEFCGVPSRITLEAGTLLVFTPLLGLPEA